MGKHRFKKNNKKGDNDKTNSRKETQEKGVRLNYESTVKENSAFEKYYKMQKICPENEWDTFMAACRESLPSSFRITGSRNEAKAMLHIIENKMIKDIIEVGKNEPDQVEIKPFALPWYPDKMAWQINLGRNDIRRNEVYLRFHNFLISETESGNISRQEAVSMIPPLALQVKPHHKVLDMCASPGSKTAQIIEMLHAEDSKPPEGYVIANDLDNKRCYMLVHQGKRLQSPAFVVTNQDASNYPDLFCTGEDGQKVPLKFDRVLCDVPCSGDGTMRKNVDVWRKWNPANSLYLHQVQYQILKRGIELLKVGGLLVYSTCSMNQQEDEAVVLRLLREAEGAVELREINLPNLKHTKGLSHWTVCDRDLNVFEKLEDVPEKWKTTIHSNAYPPSTEEAPLFRLDRCMRILPHQQNTGGFFISLLTKTKNLPWENTSLEEKAQTETKDEKVEEKPTRLQPPPKKVRRIQGFKEDPFIFMNDDHEIWPQIKEFYDLDENLKSTNFIRRTEDGKIKNLYLTTESIRDFVIHNDKALKIINIGVKALARIDNKWSTCNFRLCQEGLPSLCPSVRGRRIQVSKEDLILMLEQSEDDKAPLLESFSENTREQIERVERGSLLLSCEFMVDDGGPRCNLHVVGWKGAVSLRVYVQRNDRMHYLRICGMDTSKYEVNKFNKEKEAKAAAVAKAVEVLEDEALIAVDDVETGSGPVKLFCSSE